MTTARKLADPREAQNGGPGSTTDDTLTGVRSTPGGGADRPRSPSKLARLEKRQAMDKAKIAAEKQRLHEIETKKLERQFRTVGEICCKTASGDADFAAALRVVLDKGADTKARAFLRERGMNL